MKKILSMFIILLIAIFIVDVIRESNNTQIVLLSGEIMGFELNGYKKENKHEGLIPTSAHKLGTITFIKKETHEFAALGHSAVKYNGESKVSGICYEVNIDNIDRSYQNHIGSIHGVLKNQNQIGIVNKSNEFGIFGTINTVKESKYKEIETASKYEVRRGDAELMIALENEELHSYKIKIVAVNYMSENKNIKIKIQDEKLITKTGGILQGMSGAPIIQKGKLVGAINFANPDNPEDAYAIFIDKLI